LRILAILRCSPSWEPPAPGTSTPLAADGVRTSAGGDKTSTAGEALANAADADDDRCEAAIVFTETDFAGDRLCLTVSDTFLHQSHWKPENTTYGGLSDAICWMLPGTRADVFETTFCQNDFIGDSSLSLCKLNQLQRVPTVLQIPLFLGDPAVNRRKLSIGSPST
jgi:hypothetical protein